MKTLVQHICIHCAKGFSTKIGLTQHHAHSAACQDAWHTERQHRKTVEMASMTNPASDYLSIINHGLEELDDLLHMEDNHEPPISFHSPDFNQKTRNKYLYE